MLAELPAGQASNVLFLVPVVAIALGWLVLGDVPGPIVLLGGGLSVLGVMLSRGPRKPQEVPSKSIRTIVEPRVCDH